MTDPSSYRLRRGESAVDGVRRVAGEQLADALANLRDPGGDRGRAIHEARKDLKKTRAVLRLVRPELGKRRYRAESRRLRDAGRSLSRLRDADVKLATVGELGERFAAEVPRATVEALSEALRRELAELSRPGSNPGGEATPEAIAAIETSLAAVRDWRLRRRGWKLIKDGLERSYKRGRRAFRETVASPTPERVHQWRKRSKDLWYHLRLLHGCWPEVVGELAGAAHELSDLLGDHHDLEVLAADVRARGDLPDANGERAVLVELIGRRQDELLERAIPIGERLYAERPPAFRRRMRTWWRAWRPD
jgi:CHAD domain-containing protein